jgi:hypothetical protein
MADASQFITFLEANWKVVLLTIIVTAPVIFGIVYFLFRERLANKNSRIEHLEYELERLKRQPERLLHKQHLKEREIKLREDAIADESHSAPAEYMPLSEAAQIAYEELRACGNSAHVTMAERDSTATTEEILQYFSIAISKEVNVFGKHPPSTKLERLDRSEIDRKGILCDGGDTFKYYAQDKAKYVDIAIKRVDLESVIEKFKTVTRLG